MYIMSERPPKRWTIAKARQHLPKLIALAAREPQAVYRRDKLVAGVVSPELKQKIEATGLAYRAPSLAAELEELRGLCAEEDYQLSTPKRVDRKPARKTR
jgi:hypothetical protein